MSAKHEGGNVEVEQKREHPSDILEYFMSKEEITNAGLWEAFRINHLDRLDSVNATARALTENGLTFFAARNLHQLK